MIRVIITQNIESEFKAIKRFSASGRYGETITNREHVQQFGFTSRPKPGAEGVVVQQGSSFILIASDDRRYRLRLQNDGDVAIYTDQNNYILLKANHDIEIKSTGTVVVNSDNIKLGGSVGTKKLITDAILTTLQALTLPVSGAVAGPPVPGTFTAVAHATTKAEAL